MVRKSGKAGYEQPDEDHDDRTLGRHNTPVNGYFRVDRECDVVSRPF